MAIVKMKKLRVMAMADSRDRLLRALLRLGCVEIREPDSRLADPAWAELLRRETSRLAETKNDLASVNAALEALRRCGGLKDGMLTPRRQVTQEDFLNEEAAERPREVSGTVNALLQDIARLQGEENRLLSRRAALDPWMGLNMPLELTETAHVLFRPGVLPGGADTAAIRNELAGADAAAELYEISAEKQQRCCLLVCHKADEAAVSYAHLTLPTLLLV